MNARDTVASYLIFQAVGTAAWWALLSSVPSSVTWFQPSGWPADALHGFWLADILLLIGGSMVVAAGVFWQRSWAVISVWSLAMAVWYPTFYCVGVSILTDEAWIASAVMVGMAGVTMAMATIHGNAQQSPATIRVTPMTKTTAVAWTFMQTLIFWSVFLWNFPKGIVELESRLEWSSFEHIGQIPSAIALFAFSSLLGAWSGFTMAFSGNGTPLPTATAPRLVVCGPYRFVRNPMALAGIAQGIAVGWWMGSYGVLAYAICGAFVWQVFVRPVEEADLENRFGASYEQYRKSVLLWVPRFRVKRFSEKP